MAAVRYRILILFFFLLSISLPPAALSLSEADALLQFKASITNARALDSWKPNTLPCNPAGPNWVGLNCQNGNVRTLSLVNMGLAGKIDLKPLEQLPNLRFILIANNSFTGPIPEFNRLVALKGFYISNNQFSGEIPSHFFSKMEGLKKLWLSGNEFTGKIPLSIGELPILKELRLESNQFSGPILPLTQPTLTELDLSDNKLEGEIPESLSRFNASSFKNNPGLCGKPVGTECEKALPPEIAEEDEPDDLNTDVPLTQPTQQQPAEESSSSSQAKWVVLGIVVSLLVLTILFKAKQKDDRFDLLGKENLDEVVQVHIPSTNRRSMSSASSKGNGGSTHSRKGVGGGSHRGGGGGKGVGDLVVVNDEKGVFGLPDLMKAAAEVLGNGGLGSAYKAMMANGVSVVVKRLREMNKISKDTFDAEIRRLGALKHKNILAPLAYHFRKDEKLMVSEYVPKGSLLYILHGMKLSTFLVPVVIDDSLLS